MKSAKQFRFWGCLSIAVLMGGAISGCDEKKTPSTTEVKPASTYFPIKIGNETVRLQIAALNDEMMTGLMHRRDLQPDQGMVFIYPQPDRMSFYMRNTPTPLDIGYFSADGILREKYAMYPFDETTVPSKSNRIQFSVEMNQGWYDQHNVRPGAQIDLKAIAAALKARGLEPRHYGFPDN